MDYQEENNYPKAFLATGLIVGTLLALCFLIVFKTPVPEDMGTGGILVNYGTTPEGSGSDFTSAEEPSVAENPNKTAPDKVTPDPPTEKPTPAETSNQDVVTQNTEDAPEVATAAKKPTTTAVATTPAKPVAKPVVNQNALYKGKANNGTGAGDGTTDKPGNQGVKEGSTLANNYGPGGSGTGLSLANWKFVDAPDVKNVHRVPGTVVIDFTIDENGNVLTASANKQLTKASLDLVQNCVDAIKASRFTSTASATGNTKGRMSFIFKVD